MDTGPRPATRNTASRASARVDLLWSRLRAIAEDEDPKPGESLPHFVGRAFLVGCRAVGGWVMSHPAGWGAATLLTGTGFVLAGISSPLGGLALGLTGCAGGGLIYAADRYETHKKSTVTSFAAPARPEPLETNDPARRTMAALPGPGLSGTEVRTGPKTHLDSVGPEYTLPGE